MSKELEVWERIKDTVHRSDSDADITENGDIEIIETALKNAERYKKGIQILRKKNIDPTRIKYAVNADDYNYNIYPINKTIGIELFPKITQEEYKDLKEVFK